MKNIVTLNTLSIIIKWSVLNLLTWLLLTQLFQKRKKYFTPHFFLLVENISVNNIIINTINTANATGTNDFDTLLYNSIIII